MENVDSDVYDWGDAMFKVMTDSIDGGADKEDVCAWSKPESEILTKIVKLLWECACLVWRAFPELRCTLRTDWCSRLILTA